MADEVESGMKSLTLRTSDDDEVEPVKKILTVRTSDDEEYDVEEEVAKEWVTIDHMIQHDCAYGGVIPLPNVSSVILCKVMNYCSKHVQLRAAAAEEAAAAAKAAAVKAEAPAMTATKELEIFDANFVDVDLVTLFDLMEAADYLVINELLNLISQTVANMIKGKTTEQIRQTLHITNDMTPDEEAEVKKRDPWAFE